MPLGDTAITLDPIAGQGANNANRMAKYVADAVIARRDHFDAAWMTAVSEAWWEFHGRWAYAFTNMFLEPLAEPAAAVLGECGRNRLFADQKFFGNFSRPQNLFPWIEDTEGASRVVKAYQARKAA